MPTLEAIFKIGPVGTVLDGNAIGWKTIGAQLTPQEMLDWIDLGIEPTTKLNILTSDHRRAWRGRISKLRFWIDPGLNVALAAQARDLSLDDANSIVIREISYRLNYITHGVDLNWGNMNPNRRCDLTDFGVAIVDIIDTPEDFFTHEKSSATGSEMANWIDSDVTPTSYANIPDRWQLRWDTEIQNIRTLTDPSLNIRQEANARNITEEKMARIVEEYTFRDGIYRSDGIDLFKSKYSTKRIPYENILTQIEISDLRDNSVLVPVNRSRDAVLQGDFETVSTTRIQ